MEPDQHPRFLLGTYLSGLSGTVVRLSELIQVHTVQNHEFCSPVDGVAGLHRKPGESQSLPPES